MRLSGFAVYNRLVDEPELFLFYDEFDFTNFAELAFYSFADFAKVIEVRRRLKGAVTVALTATATERVRADIREQLSIGAGDEFIAIRDGQYQLPQEKEREEGDKEQHPTPTSTTGESVAQTPNVRKPTFTRVK